MDENDDKPEDLGCFPRFSDKPIFVLYVYIYLQTKFLSWKNKIIIGATKWKNGFHNKVTLDVEQPLNSWAYELARSRVLLRHLHMTQIIRASPTKMSQKNLEWLSEKNH